MQPCQFPPPTVFDASLIQVHRDTAQTLTSQHSGGRLLDQLRLSWLKLLADNAPPALAALPKIVPNNLVAERPGPSTGSLSGSGVPLVGILHSLAPDR